MQKKTFTVHLNNISQVRGVRTLTQTTSEPSRSHSFPHWNQASARQGTEAEASFRLHRTQGTQNTRDIWGRPHMLSGPRACEGSMCEPEFLVYEFLA